MSPMEVLVVFADESDRAALSGLDGCKAHCIDAGIDHWKPTPGFDILEYVERCRRFLQAHRVDGVVCFHDLGDLVAAILAQEFGLPGTSIESAFLCLHKYYTRQREPAPIRCEALSLWDPHPQVSNYPCFLKPPWLKLSLLGFRLDGAADLARALALARREYPGWQRQYLPLFEAAVDHDQYPLAVADVFLVEELVEGQQVTVEGWVESGRVHLWAITDTNAYPGRNRAFDNFSLPSRHSPAIQRRLVEDSKRIIQRLGFEHGFFNAEFWCQPDRLVLIEVNGRAAASFDGLYQRCLGASVFEAATRLACGHAPAALPQVGGVVGGQFNFITFASGWAHELIDLDTARLHPDVSLFVAEGDWVEPVSDLGSVLAQVELFGSDYDQIKQQADRLRRFLLRQPEASPW